MMNRALIVKSFFPELTIRGESQCDDVEKMQQAIEKLSGPNDSIFDCGAAGTVLRFLLARLSRLPGEFTLMGEERLFSRPMFPLIESLKSLGVESITLSANKIELKSHGWEPKSEIFVDLTRSSQFASAILLSCWNLPRDLTLTLSEEKKSESYMVMTLDMLRKLGMQFHLRHNTLRVLAGQKIQTNWMEIDPDMSSCFTLAAFAALTGSLELEGFPPSSTQPDFQFLKIMGAMGVPMTYENRVLKVSKAQRLNPIEIDLSNNPDLFPVLAVMLTEAEGESHITGIDHLVFKESNRIENTLLLMKEMGYDVHYEKGLCKIFGGRKGLKENKINFDSDQDHRMAMAAALAKQLGYNLEISRPEVVKKSFPEFWKVVKF